MKATRLPGRLPGGRLVRMVVLALVLVGLAALAAPARAADPASGNGAGAVTDWSRIAQDAIGVERPPASSEVLLGIVQVAVYDTVVAIHGGARPFAVSPRVTRGAASPSHP